MKKNEMHGRESGRTLCPHWELDSSSHITNTDYHICDYFLITMSLFTVLRNNLGKSSHFSCYRLLIRYILRTAVTQQFSPLKSTKVLEALMWPFQIRPSQSFCYIRLLSASPGPKHRSIHSGPREPPSHSHSHSDIDGHTQTQEIDA